MGKKSKRKSKGSDDNTAPGAVTSPPPLRTPTTTDGTHELEETLENLRFEDPFEDQFEEEEFVEDDDEEDMKPAAEPTSIPAQQPSTTTATAEGAAVQGWTPLNSHKLSQDERLEINEEAYTMHHALTPEWPSLSFDFVSDQLGSNRTRFPHECLAVVGTSGAGEDGNKLMLLKLSDLNRCSKKKDVDGDDSDSDSDSESDEETDDPPTLEHLSLSHPSGGVNRLRVMPEKPIVATWSDAGVVHLFDLQSQLALLERNAGKGAAGGMSGMGGAAASMRQSKGSFFDYEGHGCEGYALDWSKVSPGRLVTGDVQGAIHVWDVEAAAATNTPSPAATTPPTKWSITKHYQANQSQSVEDLQWSPTEATVLAAGECGGMLKIYDTRQKSKPMIEVSATNQQNIDINVIAWNHHVTNLLATGCDDGTLSVWDLRTFGGGGGSKKEPLPLARFTSHAKPITSVEWHPTDESMIVCSDEDATFVYDLSIEEEEDAKAKPTNPQEDIPPQLLFVHCGSQFTKEVHWHPQIPSMLMTTSQTGYSLFIPSNL